MAIHNYLDKTGLSQLWSKAKAAFADKTTTQTELNKKFELPSGGTNGQFLSKTSSGTEWKSVEINVDDIPKATSSSYGLTKYLEDSAFNAIVNPSGAVEIPISKTLSKGTISSNNSKYENGHVYISFRIEVPYGTNVTINRSQEIFTYSSIYQPSASQLFNNSMNINLSASEQYTRSLYSEVSGNKVSIKMQNAFTDLSMYCQYSPGTIDISFDYEIDPNQLLPEYEGTEYATIDQLASKFTGSGSGSSGIKLTTLWEGSVSYIDANKVTITLSDSCDNYDFFVVTAKSSDDAVDESYYICYKQYSNNSSDQYILSGFNYTADTDGFKIIQVASFLVSTDRLTLTPYAYIRNVNRRIFVAYKAGSSAYEDSYTYLTKIQGGRL